MILLKLVLEKIFEDFHCIITLLLLSSLGEYIIYTYVGLHIDRTIELHIAMDTPKPDGLH
jgi:hypothetical protein